MLYLVIFAALAIGFYTATSSAVAIASNERRIYLAHNAAESGLGFIGYQIESVRIPTGSPDEVWDELTSSLKSALEGTGNLGSRTVYIDDEQMLIPADPDEYITLDSGGSQFRVQLERSGQRVAVKVTGKVGSQILRRAIQLEYDLIQNTSTIFDYGLATRSKVSMNSNSRIVGATDAARGSILSTTTQQPALAMDGNATISGRVSLANSAGQVTAMSNSSIGGYIVGTSGFNSQIKKGIEPPEFPTVSSAIFEPYATNVLAVPLAQYDQYLKNIRIKAGTNPRFNNNSVLEGVIFIETPNQILFDSNTKIRGVVVVQDNPIGDPTINRLEFQSNVTLEGVESLDPAVFGDLTKLTGTNILAPQFHVHFNSNFGSTGGAIVAGRMEFDSNANGTIRGSVINLDDTGVHFDGNASIVIETPPGNKIPTGLSFSSTFRPIADTYEEVIP